MPMIEISGLSKNYGSNTVLKSLDAVFEGAGITAVLGPNGSGKTTLIKTILGLVLPDRGQISVNKRDVKRDWMYRKQIGYLPQIARFPENLKVIELLEILLDLRTEESRHEELLELFQLGEFLNHKMGNLSGGTLQKVNLVGAFMFDSPILFLDEPTAGLDPVSMITFKKLIQAEKERGKLILVTTHILGLVEEIANEMVYILNGKIHFRGTPIQMKSEQGTQHLDEAIANLLIQNGHQKPRSNGRMNLLQSKKRTYV